VATLSFPNKAGEEICFEVKKYLPYRDKIELVSSVINQSIDDNGYYNPMRVELYTTLEVMYAYTNLTFTEKQKEDPFKLYDLLVSTGIFERVAECIKEDLYAIQSYIEIVIENIYAYNNSIAGILDTVSKDYSNLDLDASVIRDKMANPDDIKLLKDIITKLG
jgi:hypothetical protein